MVGDREYILLHAAVSLTFRFAAFKKQPPIKARQGIRTAILHGDLQVFWMTPAAFEDNSYISIKVPSAPVPAWLFENVAASDVALLQSYLPVDPGLILPPEHRKQLCVVERAAFKAWLGHSMWDDFREPANGVVAYDTALKIPKASYRALRNEPYVPLSAALSWIDAQFAVSGQDYVSAAIITDQPDDLDRRHADALSSLIHFGLQDGVSFMGRPFADEEGDALNDYQTLTHADLYNFQRYDCEIEGLLPGRGIAFSDFEEVSPAEQMRTDGFRDIVVKRAGLIDMLPEKRMTEPTKKLEAAISWLNAEFAKDLHEQLSKQDFREKLRQSQPHIGSSTFLKAWDAIAPRSRRMAGRPSAKAKTASLKSKSNA